MDDFVFTQEVSFLYLAFLSYFMVAGLNFILLVIA
jgi:hypothetical protein